MNAALWIRRCVFLDRECLRPEASGYRRRVVILAEAGCEDTTGDECVNSELGSLQAHGFDVVS